MMRDGYAYARGRGRSANRDSMGRYSREDGYSMDDGNMIHELNELMQQAPNDRIKQEFQRFIDRVESL